MEEVVGNRENHNSASSLVAGLCVPVPMNLLIEFGSQNVRFPAEPNAEERDEQCRKRGKPFEPRTEAEIEDWADKAAAKKNAHRLCTTLFQELWEKAANPRNCWNNKTLGTFFHS